MYFRQNVIPHWLTEQTHGTTKLSTLSLLSPISKIEKFKKILICLNNVHEFTFCQITCIYLTKQELNSKPIISSWPPWTTECLNELHQ